MNDRAESLLNEANPRATYELLAEWEAFANLPDACTGSTLTLQERRAVLVQRLTAMGGQSVSYFQSMVKRLGYTVEITEYRPFVCGVSQCGMQALPAQDAFCLAGTPGGSTGYLFPLRRVTGGNRSPLEDQPRRRP